MGNDDGWSAVYCDTDSCFSITDRTSNIGSDLGQFKEEGLFIDFEALAPKTYSYVGYDPGGVQGPGSLEAHSKGIEDPTRNWARIVLGEGIHMSRGVKGLRTALRDDNNTFVRKSITRRVLGTEDVNGVRWYGDRWLGPDGVTHAINAREVV